MRAISHLECGAFALLLFACADPADRPIGPGGGPPGPNVAADSGPANARALGRICEVTSLTDQGECQPLLNSGLQVSTFDSIADVDDDGTFNLEIERITLGHVPIYVISTDEWFGGAISVDSEPGDELDELEVPLMTRETMEATVAASGAAPPSGDGIVALQATGFNGVPMEDVDFGPIEGKMPHHGGPTAFNPGGTTSSTGTAVYFGINQGADGFEFEFADSGQNYMVHSILGSDTFTIVPVQIDR